jgi:aerobic-type carbon monoxide dehydrogenase small subunit (CoxS/CutS family)
VRFVVSESRCDVSLFVVDMMRCGRSYYGHVITLKVNGQEHIVRSSDDCPLLLVLRNEIGLSGPRLGCGAGDCGACAVLVDDHEVRSCITPVGTVEGEITTLEGLARAWRDGNCDLHPVQQAWIDEQVPQCGYCQNGMIIAAVDLLRRLPDPSVAEIKRVFSEPYPHLCRCGTYTAIVRAVRRAAEAML